MKRQPLEIGEEQIFYFLQRGIDLESAISLIISGFFVVKFSPNYQWNLH